MKKALITALLAALIAASGFATEARPETSKESADRKLATTLSPTTNVAPLTAMLGDAAVPADRLIKLARDGVKFDSAKNVSSAFKLGGGLGTKTIAATRGLNWNARLSVAW